MTDFWAKYKNKYISEPTLRKSGYYKLSDVLQMKLKNFEKKGDLGGRYCEYFTWDEFYEFITTTTGLTLFFLNGLEYGLEIGEKESFFYTEGTQSKIGFSEKYETPKELFENVRIDNKSIKEVWENFTLMNRE